MLQILTLVLVLFGWAGTAQAAPFIDDSFEYADNAAMIATWTSSCTAALHVGSMEISSTRAHSGTKSLKQTRTADNNSTTSCFMDRFFGGTETIYFRVWVYFETDFRVSSVNSKMYQVSGATSGPGFYPSIWWSLWETVNHGERFVVEGSPTTLIQDGQFPLGRWVCHESQITMNSVSGGTAQANGILRAWRDGSPTPTIERTDLVLRNATEVVVSGTNTNGPSSRFARTRLYSQNGVGVLYFDEFAVGLTRIGCGGSTPPPLDATAPTPPTSPAANSGTSTLTWTSGTDTGGSGLASTEIQRCAGAGCSTFGVLATPQTPAQSTGYSYVDTSAQAGITYLYRLRHFDGQGNPSTFTSTVTLTVPSTNRRVLFSDTFIRADNADIGSTYDGGYTTGSSYKIASNSMAPSVAFENNHVETYNVAVPSTCAPGSCDQWASVQMKDKPNAVGNLYALIRWSAPATFTGYECAIITDNTVGELRRRPDGTSAATLGSATLSVPFANTDRIRAEAVGTTIRCYVVRTNAQGQQSEELFASATDSTYTSGRPGVRAAIDDVPGIRIGEFATGDFTSVVDSSITHDATATSALANTTSTITWPHTVGVADNRLLAVCVQTRNSNTAVTVSNVTANGVSLAKFRQDTMTSGTNNIHTSLWRQIAPSSGSNTIVATLSAAPNSWGVGTSSSYSGVEQVAPVDATGGATGTSTAVSLPLTTTVTGTLALDCVAGLDDFTAVGGSQTIRSNRITTVGADGVGMSTKPLSAAGAATTAWTQATASIWAGSVMAVKPAQVNNLQRPMVLTGTMTASGATGLTYGTTTPTALFVRYGPNSGFGVQEVTVPIASVPGGVLSLTWPAGSEFAQIFAVDAFGKPNGVNLEYIARTLIGVAPAANVNAVVMTNILPANGTELYAGIGNATISMTVDQTQLPRGCRASTSDVAYASMAATYQMTVNGTVASVAFPVTNGLSYTVYRTCVTLDDNGNETSESATRSSSTFTVASSTGDVTPPGNVANLACTTNGTQVTCAHTAATDAVIYEAYRSDGVCSTYTLATSYAHPTVSFTLLNLAPETTYCLKVQARDTVGNPSAAYSNVATFVTPISTDLLPPGDVPYASLSAFDASMLVFFQVGADAVNTTVEYCDGADCTPGESSVTGAASPILVRGLTSGTRYRFTLYHTDQAGNISVSKYPVIEATTTTGGLGVPRGYPLYGVTPPSATRSARP